VVARLLGAAIGTASFVVQAADCGGARPCRCGDRMVADYSLATDLGPCPGDGLRLAARVIFDGAGHAIVGSGAKRSVGLQVTAAAGGSFVQNVTVRGFERGIRLNGASGVELTRVAAHGNGDFRAREGYGIDLAGGASSNRIEHARVYGNADEGVHFGSHARANRLAHSEIYDNGRENVYVLQGVDNVVEECVLRGAGNAAAYIKHSKGTILVRNEITARPVVIRGATSGTRLIDNAVADGGIVLEPYADEKMGRTRPTRTLVRGGSVSGDRTCVRVDGADGTVLEEIRLTCPTTLEIGGGSAIGVRDVKLGEVRCTGSGEVRELERVEVRFVDAEGAPVPDVLLESIDQEGARTTADAGGAFIGDLVGSVRACPKLLSKPVGPIRLTWAGGSTTRALGELSGRVVLAPAGESR